MEDEKPNNGKNPAAPDWLIENIAEASRNARKIYLLYLGFLAYCALTVVSTTDRMLVLNEPANLPIVNVSVPLEGFFIFAPILAIMTFIYFQFYVQKLNSLKWEHERDYGKIGKNRVYPWIVNVLDYPEHGFVGFLQKFVVRFALWWSLPTVLIIFALYYVKKHDLWMSYYLGLLPLVAALLAVGFRLKYERVEFSVFLKGRIIGLTMVGLLLIAEIFFMTRIIPWSRQGGKYDFLRKWICVDLSYQVLVDEPETDYEGIYWGDFRGAHLEGANLRASVLKRADLREAYLQQASLVRTILQEADLKHANLQESNLYYANLQEANLIAANFQEAYPYHANLQGADLRAAKLQGAVLSDANLQGALLYRANLQGANLRAADLQGANLIGVDSLTIEQLKDVYTLYEAQLDSALYEQVKAQYPHLLEPPPEEEE